MDDPDLQRSLGRIEGRLAGIEKGLDSLKVAGLTSAKDASTRAREVEERVGKLERGRAWLLGAVAAVGAVASAIVKFLPGGGGHP